MLLKVENAAAWEFYLDECAKSNWSTRQLERKINSFYTLPEDNNQIYASKYKLYMPTEEELKRELEKEQ